LFGLFRSQIAWTCVFNFLQSLSCLFYFVTFVMDVVRLYSFQTFQDFRCVLLVSVRSLILIYHGVIVLCILP
jgi:hypothetical protein